MVQAVAQSTRADGAPVRIHPELWRRLAADGDRESFCDGWLRIQAGMLPAVTRALVLDFDDAVDEFMVAAVWPDADTAHGDLLEAAGESADDRQPLVMHARGKEAAEGPEPVILCYPICIGDAVRSVAVFEIGDDSEDTLRDAMARLQWGSAWLEVMYLRRRIASGESALDRLRVVTDLVGTALEQGRYEAAVSAMVTELAARLNCDRVSYGEYRGRRNHVKALSHSGQFGRQMNLIGDIGRAMDEAVDQHLTVVHPPREGDAGITRMHAELAGRHGCGVVISVPMYVEGRAVGALCFEFPATESVDSDTIDLCDTLGALLAPLVHDKRVLNRTILVKNAVALRDTAGRVLGPRHLLLKFFLIAALAGGTYGYSATGSYKITADAVLEGAVQRVVSAPFAGYVAASHRRAGDRVEQDEILGELDDRDLRLELIQLTSERAQAASQYREAQAAHERARTKIFEARIEQADARISLVREQIERTRLKAPFTGIVVSGDLSQSLGAAVERGEVLFEVAPLDDYRINLKVDERDVDYIEVGQPVSLVLSALPSERIEATVDKVTPVSTAADGRNYFRVEAHYRAQNSRLRPGMEGVAKIGIDQRPLWWIWTRELVDWSRLWLWRWVN